MERRFEIRFQVSVNDSCDADLAMQSLIDEIEFQIDDPGLTVLMEPTATEIK